MQNDQSLGDQAAFLSVNVGSPSLSLSFPDPLPSLPILCATRLRLDLLLNDSVIDLKAVSEVVLADAGATLQILRLIGEEFPNEEDRPQRIEDCIVSLSVDRVYQTVCASEKPHSGPHVVEWQRCRRLAECARELASAFEGFSPEEAYLVGLLCRLGKFPHLLGWKGDSSVSSESDALGVMLASHWNLPRFVLSAIQEQHELEGAPKWKNILNLADQLIQQSAA